MSKKVKKKSKYVAINEFIKTLTKRERILMMIAIGFILGFFIFSFLRYGLRVGNPKDVSNLNQITFEEYKEAVTSKEKRMIYIDDSSNETYKDFKEIVELEVSNRSLVVDFFDVNNLSDDELMEFMKQTTVTKDEYILPLILVVENKKVEDSSQGILTDVELRDFLSRNSIGYKKASK